MHVLNAILCNISCQESAHLPPRPGVGRGDELEDGVAGDAQHGGESHQPADEVGPAREFIVHVLGGRPHHDVEHEHCLRGDEGKDNVSEEPFSFGINYKNTN